ncbi:hypothetical protein GW813_02735 [bacterium]|nr:hypothetical protein [bacterium]PIV81083.1 MAG: hypothetical protein COW53_06250 [bacterium CG17_big_fil_post_rev_8_21_14_2_50_64_8]PJA74494.1 MAG: hypothetical protein CO151_09370 [bacterium CG_4_9_14_3_um_filter_65_15]
MKTKLLCLAMLILLSLVAAAGTSAADPDPSSASMRPVDSPTKAEIAAITELIKEHRQNLRELLTLAESLEPSPARDDVLAKIQAAKSGMEVRMIEARIRYATEAGQWERVSALQETAKKLRAPHASYVTEQTEAEVEK